MKLNKITSYLFFVTVATTAPFMLGGCDNSSSGESSSVTPPPAPPTPPKPIVPQANSVTVRTLYTTERLTASYIYSDVEGRKEGNSDKGWFDTDNGSLISQENPLTITDALFNKSVKYCVTPVTFDGVSGAESCSPATVITNNSQDITYSTDWKTDTDYINDSAHDDVRNGPSGNIHFYYNINLTPISVAQSQLGTLQKGNETEIARNFYDSYNFDNVYATVSNDGVLMLTNNTSRYIKEPVVRINDDNYYTISGYTLEPFKTVNLAGYSGPKVDSIAFVDTNPSWKMNVAGFMQDDSLVNSDTVSESPFPVILDKIKLNDKLISRPDVANSSVYGPVNETQAEQYNASFRLLRIAYNRFDVVKYFFDYTNNNVSISGQSLGYPFDNLSSANLCTNPDPSADYNSCGANNVVARYAYRLHALKRLVSHEPDTMYKILVSDDIAEARSDINPVSTPGTMGIMAYAMGNAIYDVAHENGHRLGYSDASGLAYGWSGDILPLFLQNMDFYHLTDDNLNNLDLQNPSIEQSDYFADYHWIDNKTVDVHFYSKGSSLPIKNIAVLADDEESGRSFPNFFGTWDTCMNPDWTDVSDCETWISTNWDGSLMLDNQLSVINSHTIRIKLKDPIANYSRAIMVYGSSADTNDSNGIWKTNYTQRTADSFAIQIPYDQEMNIQDPVNKVAYVTKLANPEIIRNGSTGHIGLNGVNNVRAPDYFLDGGLYSNYTKDEALQHCKDLGYTGFGVIPFGTGNSSSDPLGNLIYKYVYNGVMIGLNHDDGTTPQIIKGSITSTHPISSMGNIDKDKANLIVCALP